MAFASTYTASATAFSAADLKNILALGGVATAAFLLLTLRVLFLARSTMGVNAMLTLGTLASVGTAHVVHTELYLGGHWVVLILLSVAAGAALFVAFRIIDEQRRGGIVLSAMTLIGLMIVVNPYEMYKHEMYKVKRASLIFGDTTNIREISFQETPNLYFVSFDALVPRALLNKHLQLETTDFHDLFEERFRRFPNLFVEATWSVNSHETLLSLDASHLKSLRKPVRKSGRKGSLFSGRAPSPLFSILRKNGYEVTTICRNPMFGFKKGPYVDNYIMTKKYTTCDLLDPKIQALSFWGYCSHIALGKRKWDDLSAHKFSVGDPANWAGLEKRDLDDLTLHRTAAPIMKVDVRGEPQFVMAYLSYPGHVDRSLSARQRQRSRKHTGARIFAAATLRPESWTPLFAIWRRTIPAPSCWCTATTALGCPRLFRPNMACWAAFILATPARPGLTRRRRRKLHDRVRRRSRLAPLLVRRGERSGAASQQDSFWWPGRGPRLFHLRGASV